MGSIQHHQSRSEAFLRRARDATDAALAASQKSPADHNHALAEAADCLSRAASHAVTALAVHDGFRHNTTHRLQIVIHHGIWLDLLRRGHLRTFRQTYTLPAVLNLPHLGRISPKAAAASVGDGNAAAGDDNRNAANAANARRRNCNAGNHNRSAGNVANARNRSAGNGANAWNRSAGNAANARRRNYNVGNAAGAGNRNAGNCNAGDGANARNAANARNHNAAIVAGNAAGDADANPHLNYRPHHRRRPETAGHRPPIAPIQAIRRMGRRVNALRKAIAAIIAGHAKPVRPAKRFLRVAPEDLPETTSKYGPIRYVGEIMRLPNFESVRRRYGLTKTPMSTTESDTGYRAPGSAAARRLCRCAPAPRHTLADHDDKVILVPEWRNALTQAYPHLKLPLLIPF